MKRLPPTTAISRARALRRDATDSEKAMWRMLRNHFPAARFRRQVPIRHYIADFVSHAARLVIEIDGGQHNSEVDANRTALIEAEGYRVRRLWNDDVLGNLGGCAALVALWVDESLPPPSKLR